MTTPHATPEPATGAVDVDWKIAHLARSIRSRERLLTWGGFATPHTPEHPEVTAERIAAQQEAIAQRRIELTYWEGIKATQTVTPSVND